jgi:flagellar hook-associated protein 3 FlgL
VRASIGGRLNTLQSQLESNESNVIVTQAALATLRDTDIAEAISQLTLEQATLDAALAVFSKITSSSLFNYLK